MTDHLGLEQARGVIARFGIANAVVTPLPGWTERNYRIDSDGHRYVLKIAPEATHPIDLSLQNAVMQHLQTHPGLLSTPMVLGALNGVDLLEVSGGTARLLSYLDGKPYSGQVLDKEQAFQLGAGLGDLVSRLAPFHHPCSNLYRKWNLTNAADTIEKHRRHVVGDRRHESIDKVLAVLRTVDELWSSLGRQIIHGDANDLNVLLTGGTITALIDFGDVVHSVRVAELAIAYTYAMFDADDPVAIGAAMVRGWMTTAEITEAEGEALLPLIIARLGVSVCVSASQHDTKNPHHLVSERAAWALLERLFAADRDAIATELVAGAAPLTD